MLTLLKIGGKVLDHPATLQQVLDDFASLAGPKILVHGGGKTATQVAAKLGIEAPLIQGRRVTSPEMMKVAMMVYGGLMNKQLVSMLQARGCQALGLTGADLDVIRAEKRPVKEIDYGLAGDIVAVNGEALRDLLLRGIVPVLAPLTHDGQGHMLNTNADTIASTVARTLAPGEEVHLVFGFEKAGVMEDPADESSLIHELLPEDFARYRAQGVIAGGMIPKLSNAFEALEAGVHRVYICHASKISTLGSRDFVGTVIRL
ncbi:MAG: acetylglutamate kinase [Bacteroidota bacterium]